jgi:hypothetical protein
MRGALLLLGLAACSSDDTVDLTGIYQVSVAVASMPCGTDQPVMPMPAYLKFHKEMAFGINYFTFDTCNDAAATDCPSGGTLFGGSYVQAVSNGWNGVESYSTFGSSCTLGYIEDSAHLSGKMMVIEHMEWSDNMNQLTDPQCTTDEAEKRGKTMPCTQHGHIEATKL